MQNEWIRKSVGEQETFERDTRNPSFLTEQLYGMADRVIAKLRKARFTGFRTVTLTVRFADFETKNRSHSLKTNIVVDDGVYALNLLKEEALKLLLPFLDGRENPHNKAMRLLGLRLEKLF